MVYNPYLLGSLIGFFPLDFWVELYAPEASGEDIFRAIIA